MLKQIMQLWSTNEREKLLSRTLTLASYDLDPHTRMSIPVHGVELDKARHNGTVQIRVLHWVRIHVSFKHLEMQNVKMTIVVPHTTASYGHYW